MSGNKGKKGYQERKQCERESLQTQITKTQGYVIQWDNYTQIGENNMFITLMEIKAAFTNLIKNLETINMIL